MTERGGRMRPGRWESKAKGRLVFLEDLALEVGLRMSGIEFTVQNVFFFQNNFPVGLISNPINIQTPDSITDVSGSLLSACK